MDLYTAGCIVLGIEKDESILTSTYWGATPAICISC